MSLPFHGNGLIAIAKIPKIINSQVVFGTPNRNCSGSGICKVYTIHGARHLAISCELVKVRMRLMATQLQLSFPEAACSEALIQQQFGSGYFKVEEDFVLPSWLNRKINSQTLYLPQGNYPILFKNGFVWLTLPLQLL